MFTLCYLPYVLGGGAVSNLTSERISLTEVVISWNPPLFIPPRGYHLSLASVGIDMTLNSSSIRVPRLATGNHTVEVKPLSHHYASVTMKYNFMLKGERVSTVSLG